MQAERRRVRVFRGRNQAIRVPHEFELDADEAITHREGGRLIIGPVRRNRLLAVLSGLEALPRKFPDVDSGLPPLDDVSF